MRENNLVIMLLLSSASSVSLSKENEFESFLSEMNGEMKDEKNQDNFFEIPSESKKATKKLKSSTEIE